MKLSKIYANKKEFKPIRFVDGFNVVYGDIQSLTTKQVKGKVSEHNLGKTSLVDLIDFLLLKEVKKGTYFHLLGDVFLDWVFFLEIALNDGTYVTIRRCVTPSARVSLKGHAEPDQFFIDESSWDFENLSLNSKDKKKHPKKVLAENFLKFDVANDFNYRGFVSYLLRRQGEYTDVFKLKNHHKDRDWKPLLFSLLGFDPTPVAEKYELDQLVGEIKNRLNENDAENAEEQYTIKAMIEAKEAERDDLKNIIESFDFYAKELELNSSLVNDIESEISDLNAVLYKVGYSLEQVRSSIDSADEGVDLEEIVSLYEEANVSLPNLLVKKYEEVLAFSKSITKERKQYLLVELKELVEKETETKSKLKELSKRRAEILSVLNERDAFAKYKKHQEALASLEGEISFYGGKLEAMDDVQTHQTKLEKLREEIKIAKESIENQIDAGNLDFADIRKKFRDIYKKTFDYTALLVLKPNKNGNVDFLAPVMGDFDTQTAKGRGNTSSRVLCASFVLAILAHYADKSFFRFAYHDGILEGWGNNHKNYFIQTVRDYCAEFNIQYIVSMISSDVPAGFEFESNEIIRVLKKDDKLFGIEF